MWNSSEVEVKHDIPSVSPSLPLTDLMPANLRPSGSRNRSVPVCVYPSAGTHRASAAFGDFLTDISAVMQR